MRRRSRRLVAATGIAALLALGGCAEESRPPDAAGGGPDAPVSSTPSQPGADAPTRCTLAPGRVVGMTETAGRRLAERHGCLLRVIERDGMGLAVTDDYSTSRINVAVSGGRITSHDGRY